MGLSDLFGKKKQVEKISLGDPLFRILDELNSKGEYEQILQKIEEVPEDARSNELYFRKISALNSLSRFAEAKKEISLLSKRCSEPKEDARLFYSLGYIFDHTDCELKAVECYSRTKEFDPEFEGIQASIDDAMGRVNKGLAEAKASIGNAFSELADAAANSADQKKVDEDSAFSYISMVQASFLPFDLQIKIPVDDLFFKCSDEDKPKMKAYLEKVFGITDLKTLQQWFGNERIAPIFNGVKAALDKNIEPPLDKMSAAERTQTIATKLVIETFHDYIPEAGIDGWDQCTVLALARMAFSCDLISNVEFMQTALFFSDDCKSKFSSWEEFTRSVVIGGFYNAMCYDTQYDVRSATLFGNTAASFCKKTYPGITWIG